jgi:hypothetical protein
MADRQARAFWAKQFAQPALRTEIPWKEFAALIVDSALASPAQVQRLMPVLCAKVMEHSVVTGSVSMRMFDLCALWWGPFFLPDVGPPIISEIGDLLAQSWFHWDICKKEASDARLLRRQNGTFLVRVSFTDPAQSPFTLGLVRNDQPTNFRIVRIPGPNYRFCIAIPGTSSNCVKFNSLSEFVESQMALGSPFGFTEICPRNASSAACYGYGSNQF